MGSLKYGTRFAQSSEDMHDKRAHGFSYEERAAEYLMGLGYRLLAKNVNFKSGEIDLVMEENTKGGISLVFIEVRKRGTASYIRAEETITYTKERRLRSAIQQYLVKYKGRAGTIRVDLVAFQENELRHFPNFLPT